MASIDGQLDSCDSSTDLNNEIRVSTMQDLNANPDPVEPYIGMSFKSVDDAREFYNAYGKRMGFTIRTNRIRHSQKSRAIIARDYVCSKEGFRSTKHALRKDRILPPRPTTREGCKAMIRVAVKDGGQWIVTKFIGEHNHKLMTRNKAPGEQFKASLLSEAEKDKKIEDLFNELQHEKQRTAGFREQLYMVLSDIEEHAQHISVRVQDVVNNVRELESSEEGGLH
ncbi:FAR1 DNA binding domain [Macleaya cordata]|uniref:FAR1 DNA binding domain n=1 Tax=Macleaya cordata TaxID=56857 RepID=A0A200R0D9_MACCD|nr:FAR1 DNA binding domain [Macleaya cordata]